MLSRVISAEQGLPLADFKNFFCLLVAAGNDTTRYSIAMALYLMTVHPELLAQLQSGAVDDTAADEIIRLASPTMHFRRTATADTELGGKGIKKGDKVVLWFVSGNRDETVFDAPHMPRLGRKPESECCVWAGWTAFLSRHVACPP